ncbi:type 1 glutamine amidotransferase domain-containing protein [Actinocorallia sp. A-T 12471]|uniref:type 1 glutamine amidotransferase domain-containing protein n=1 Tax=Actinocorallia sp. A-T 12471 TaxID=3089813 RepID=UPI0029CEB91A|nr:type 1 glutamine amidotransferase domain-containing protein [Actinocorallia sp. A-T 12471]MDX6744479.1 type 1 glutamine amidotransferase domain-containing protein [Actinocorallia sp. A-T 12471]
MSGGRLDGTKVLAIVTNYGVEQDELTVPVERLRDDGADVEIAAPSREPIRTLVGDEKPGDVVEPTETLGEVDPAGYDLLLIPGGALNADNLRMDDDALEIIRSFASSGRPVAAICHAPWALVEADVVKGKNVTSYMSLKTDLGNAGASWQDSPEVTDKTGYTLITSRTPKDLEPFLDAIERELTPV